MGSCEDTLEVGKMPGVCPARIEFKVGLPLEGWLALAPSEVEEAARGLPFEVPFGGILINELFLFGGKTRLEDQICCNLCSLSFKPKNPRGGLQNEMLAA